MEFETPGMDVPLGDDTYRVVPQRQARLYRKLFGPKGIIAGLDDISDLAEGGMDSFVSVVGDRLYEVLAIFIPDLMPKWKFEGYASESAAERDEYDETGDHSPTHPEVLNALQTAVQVNGIGWVKKLTGFFDPQMVRAALTQYIAQQLRDREMSRTGPGSPSLPQANGESAQTSSGTSDPTPPTPSESEETADTVSPSPASTDS